MYLIRLDWGLQPRVCWVTDTSTATQTDRNVGIATNQEKRAIEKKFFFTSENGNQVGFT
jgi:hypothetical protein